MLKAENSCVKRRPRIIAIQKKLLVQLIENHFIRRYGQSNGNLDAIDPNAWNGFAEILNSWGPGKTSDQWKNSFYYMKNRIRKSVQMIKQSNASVKDNLSLLDYKLYSMSPSSFLAGFEELTGDIESDFAPNEEMPGGDDYKYEYDYGADEEPTDETHFMDESVYTADEVTQNDNTPDILQDVIVSEYGDHIVSDITSGFTENDSCRTLVVQNVEELEAYMSAPAIVSDDDEIESTVANRLLSTSANVQYEECISETIAREHDTEEFYENHLPPLIHANVPTIGQVLEKEIASAIRSKNLNSSALNSEDNRTYSLKTKFGANASEKENRSAQKSALRDSTENATRPSSFNMKYRVVGNVNGKENRSAKQSKVAKTPASNTLKTHMHLDAAKTGAKIPEIQKERLVQLIQNKFVKAFGRFTGVNGAQLKKQFWENTAKELNTLGPPRTGEQWKATFNNIKATAKAKLADDHNNVPGVITKHLTRLEEKVLSIYGIDALDGDQQLGEAGFQYKKTVPVTRRECSSTVTSGAFESLLSVNDDFASGDALDENSDIENYDMQNEVHSSESLTPRHQVVLDDRDVLEEILREIREGPVVAKQTATASISTSAAVQGAVIGRLTPAAASRVDRVSVGGNSNQGSRNVSYPDRPSGTLMVPKNITRMTQNDVSSARNSVNRVPMRKGVNGVPRLHERRQSASSERFVTNINQYFNDNDEEENDSESTHGSSRSQTSLRMRNEKTTRTVARDRSNLRHRHTSYEIVQQSVESQERFIDNSMRNHSELMFATDRNHLEMLGVINGTLRAIANIGQQFINRM